MSDSDIDELNNVGTFLPLIMNKKRYISSEYSYELV